ncbi:MAG: tRNA ((6))-methyltransferase TrmN6 [Labilithrix sp.]|nr:tRNA ((6))-methyltransferase TrmN6 [Labilithrix sp.]
MSVTDDTLFDGAVKIAQPARGVGAYRVNADALLLAAFAAHHGRKVRRACDLGAGVGAVGLSLVHLGVAEHVTMIEVDERLAALARRNAEANGWSSRIEVVEADVSDDAAVVAGSADLVVCNPPYVPPGRGRAPLPARARARTGPLDVFVDAARRAAGRRARVCFVYPAIELTTLLATLRVSGLEPKRLRAVHGASEHARIVLVEAVCGKAGGLVVERPLLELLR